VAAGGRGRRDGGLRGRPRGGPPALGRGEVATTRRRGDGGLGRRPASRGGRRDNRSRGAGFPRGREVGIRRSGRLVRRRCSRGGAVRRGSLSSGGHSAVVDSGGGRLSAILFSDPLAPRGVPILSES
jgi:hypothetical protein